MDTQLVADDRPAIVDGRQQRDVEDRLRPTASVVFEVIRRDGEEELARPLSALSWSGIVAGLAISLSCLSEALLRAHLPDTEWRPLIENLGYSVGFIVVILGRMQLFTENTITTVIPSLVERSRDCVLKTVRLWSVVFAANFVGAALAAAFFFYSGVLSDGVQSAFADLSVHIFAGDVLDVFVGGVAAGFLIAILVWLLPTAGSSALWVIMLITYLIAVADLSHVVAGSVEAVYAVLDGKVSALEAMFTFIAPAFLGNVVGGTFVFTLLVYAQIAAEVVAGEESDEK